MRAGHRQRTLLRSPALADFPQGRRGGDREQTVEAWVFLLKAEQWAGYRLVPLEREAPCPRFYTTLLTPPRWNRELHDYALLAIVLLMGKQQKARVMPDQLTKQERFDEFLRRLEAAPAARTFEEAYQTICDVL